MHAPSARASQAIGPPHTIGAISPQDAEQIQADPPSALRELLPALTTCYQDAQPQLADPALDVDVELFLKPGGDDVTTVEAEIPLVPNAPRLPDELVDCFRDTLAATELPALHANAHVLVTLQFRP
jgi:hypothetical protein